MKNTIKIKNILKAKTIFRVAGFIALAAIFGFYLEACDGFDLGGLVGGKKDGDSTGIKTLTLSGQVYVANEDYDSLSITYEAYKGKDLNVIVYGMTEKGTIKNGQFSIKLGTPTYLGDVRNDDDITVTPSGAKGFVLNSLYIENSYDIQSLSRENITMDGNTSGTQDMVAYYYFDRDITMSGKEKTVDNDGIVYTVKAFSLSLKEGWNTVYMKAQASFNESGEPTEMIITYSLTNPGNLKWVLRGYGGDDGGDEGDTTPTSGSGNVLQGTTWEAEEFEYDHEDYGKCVWTAILKFASASVTWTMDNTLVSTETDDEKDKWQDKGTYAVINGNNVVLFVDNEYENPYLDGVIIDGNKIVCSGDGPNGENIIFHKQ
jgi:hypothetical protein